jgi:ABC-type transport system involved in multi-copper enzyme maturation permease subunit
MTALAFGLPTRPLVAADFLSLRRRRGLLVVTALLTVGAVTLTYAIIEILHVASPETHGPAGGVVKLGHVAFVVSALGAVAAAICGSVAAGGDLESGVYRDLVVTGRSRMSLYASRIPAGLALLLPFVAAGYAVAAVCSVVFAGNLPAPSTGLLVDTGLWCLLQVAFYYLLAVGIASLLGSRAYTIGVLLAWRLAVTPILASISALGVARELVPGVALDALTPAGLGDSSRQGPNVPMSLAATAAVLICWAVAAVVIGGWRDTTRDA